MLGLLVLVAEQNEHEDEHVYEYVHEHEYPHEDGYEPVRVDDDESVCAFCGWSAGGSARY